MAKCMNCGAEIYWGADFMLSEVYTGEDTPEEEDTVVNCCHCPECGYSVDVIHENEKGNIREILMVGEPFGEEIPDGCFGCAGGTVREAHYDADDEFGTNRAFICNDCGAVILYTPPFEEEELYPNGDKEE